ncbi:hypothetical protein DICPUDRAFT_159931 [Dictyostelium purpureum]|uniref:NmrA-like domain-containing protein n=1 Tax=Dictyostelium purpureum TaxID=5786 RepID=F1A5B2_DICPU|nr:uncharacterized protein DICPUDRAFT_159931 [Dictyostelium purpureum]EGC28618.1 hypothetical protein DICPUDRAFT_159931 [Dictyostelium purpureum]|eukprot:XP_003294856.1 hypothetical protein DICPUDRAFT_159931 [Dictyostelium purpureum]
MSQKVVTVFPGTGKQGSAVVNALLKDGRYKVRALTRTPDSDTAKDLVKRGCQVVRCDISDSQDEIEKTFKGSDAVFLVTNFWSYWEKEFEYGAKAANAALAAGVKHFVFSSLASPSVISNGEISVPHYDLKYKIEVYARELSKKHPEFITSFIYAPFYMQNFNSFFKLQKCDDGTYSLDMPLDPNTKFPIDLGDVEDIGPIFIGIINNPTKYSGKTVVYSGSALTGDQIAQFLSKYTKVPVKFNYIPPEIFSKNPFEGADEIADMFRFYCKYGKSKQIQAAKAASKTSSSGSAGRKKWGKGRSKDKLNNAVLFDKETYAKLLKEIPTAKVITTAVVSERIKINGSLARRAIRELLSKGLIKQVIRSHGNGVYTKTN